MNETCAKCGKTKEEHFEDHGGSHRVRFWCHAQGELDGWQFTPPANSDLITSAGPCTFCGSPDHWRPDCDLIRGVVKATGTPTTETKARKVAEDVVHNWYLDNPEVEMPCNEMDNLKSAFTQALINFAKDCGGTKDL